MKSLVTATIVMMTLCAGAGKWSSSRIYTPSSPTGQLVQTTPGLDLMYNDGFAPFLGMNVAVVMNQTAVDRSGRSILDLIDNTPGINLVAIFGPEHGISGQEAAGIKIPDADIARTGTRIYSLYGQIHKPTPDQFRDVDAVIFDIHDIGARYYTYVSTMTLVMDACARDSVPFWIFDRPNPVRGDIIEGPFLNPDFSSFVGMHPIPIRHGMTMGELAILINESGWLTNGRKADLTVVPVLNWTRYQWWDETGLEWIPPSPNIPTPATALVYLGTCLIEGTNLSEGRGTHEPFFLVGAPWIESALFAQQLNVVNLPGVDFQPEIFTPKSITGMAVNPKFEGQECGGVRIVIRDREKYHAVETALWILHIAKQSYPNRFEWRSSHLDRLWGSTQLRDNLDAGRTPAEFAKTYTGRSLDLFSKERAPFLIYPVQ